MAEGAAAGVGVGAGVASSSVVDMVVVVGLVDEGGREVEVKVRSQRTAIEDSRAERRGGDRTETRQLALREEMRRDEEEEVSRR